MLGRMSAPTAARMRGIESRAYEATRKDIPENERTELARYVVLLGMREDLNAQHRPVYLERFASQGWRGAARGLDLRSSVYEGAASSFEKRWVPESAMNAHHRIISTLRDLAAIDRRAAAEIRSRGSHEHYSEGREETSRAIGIANEAVIEIVTAMDLLFEDGELRRIITRTIPG